jgi:fatty acid desaturase
MRHENRARVNRRRLLALLAIPAVVIILMALAAVVGWVGAYLIPVVVILGVIIAAVALLMWALDRLPTPPSRDRWQ